MFSMSSKFSERFWAWLFHCRVRATSLMGLSGLRAAGFTTVQKTAEDEELDVTG
jgi:hypothetical protein